MDSGPGLGGQHSLCGRRNATCKTGAKPGAAHYRLGICQEKGISPRNILPA